MGNIHASSLYAFDLIYHIPINIVTISNIIFFRDYSDILNAESLDLVSPWLAFDHVEAFPIVKSFLTHLLIHYKFEEFIQIPTNALIVTIPRLFEFFFGVQFFNWFSRSLIIGKRLKRLNRLSVLCLLSRTFKVTLG